MHRALLAFLLLAIPAAHADAAAVEFSSPAQVGGDVAASGLQAVVVIFDHTRATVHLDLAGNVQVTTHTARSLRYGFQEVTEGIWPLPGDESQPTSYDGLNVELASRPDDLSSLFLQADRIETHGLGSYGQLLALPDGDCLINHLSSNETRSQVVRIDATRCVSGANVVLRLEDAHHGALPLSLNASGVRRAEWHNLDATCRGAKCPSGGHRSQTGTEADPEHGAYAIEYAYVEATAGGGTAALEGEASAVLGAGDALDLRLDGWLRLPKAESPILCGNCTTGPDGTLRATGILNLTGLRKSDDDRLSAGLAGTFASVHLDERLLPEWVTPATVAGSAVAVTVLAFLVLKLLAVLAGIRDAEHPRRLTALDAIRSQPGLSRHRLAQLTGIPLTSLRFHLAGLERKGHVVAHQDGRAQRYYENHGKHEATWRATAALQDPNVRRLHQWLLQHPGARRGEILEQLHREHGWGKTSTERRLDRLLEAGLVSRRQGRGFATYWPDVGLKNPMAPDSVQRA